MTALYPQLRADKEFQQFFPDVYPKDKGPPRDYFFNVLNTVHPKYLEKLLTHANEQRMTAKGEGMKT